MTRSMSLALPAPRQPALVGLQPAIIGFWAILAATLFNVVLCFLNTQHLMSVTSTQIIAIESAILLAGLLAARNLMGRAAVQFSGVVIVCLLALKLLNGDLDLKIIHDLSIMLVFFLLGCVPSAFSQSPCYNSARNRRRRGAGRVAVANCIREHVRYLGLLPG